VADLRRKDNKMKIMLEKEEEGALVEKVRRVERQIMKADVPFIIRAFQRHCIFSQLKPEEKEAIAMKMFYCEADKDEYIFKQGDRAKAFFILEKGECELIINNETKKHILPGEGFGELALLYGAPRSAWVRTLMICSFWAISRAEFRRSVEEIASRSIEENRTLLDKI
jgi:cGMP-dependent protein kinase